MQSTSGPGGSSTPGNAFFVRTVVIAATAAAAGWLVAACPSVGNSVIVFVTVLALGQNVNAR